MLPVKHAEFLIQQLNVLIVDDNAYMRKIVRGLLLNIGVKSLHEAEDGIAGLELVRTVSIYSVAGRRRGTACATLFKMLRAADWGFEPATGRKYGGPDDRTHAQRHPRREFCPPPQSGGPDGRPVAGLLE